MSLFNLLKYVATEPSLNRPLEFPPCSVLKIDKQQLQWIVDAGFAPLLFRAVGAGAETLPPDVRDVLRSADLTAIIRSEVLIEATKDLLDSCQGRGIPVTLLKGISISDQYYPLAHLRPMGDIDILVAEEAHDMVESQLLRLGYERKRNYQQRDDAHHGVPLFHADRGIWIEVHTALFPNEASIRADGVFSALHVATHVIPSCFHGRTVNRLTNELQIVYIASTWIRDLAQHGIHASFLPPLLDAIFLLKATEGLLDWDVLLGWLDNQIAMASLYVMLTYLARCGFCQVDASIISRLALSQDVIGRSGLRIFHAILDSYLVQGKRFTRFFNSSHARIVLSTLLASGSRTRNLSLVPWNLAFPPDVADRYRLSYQISRLARVLRSKN